MRTVYKLAPVFDVVFPAFDETEEPGNIQAQLGHHTSTAVSVEYVNEEDPSEGYNVTVGDDDPVLVAGGGVAVDPMGNLYLFPDMAAVVDSGFVVLGQIEPTSDQH